MSTYLPSDDEMVAREKIANSLLSLGRSPYTGAQDVARNAAQAIWLRDERIRALERWLREYIMDSRQKKS